MRRTLVTAVLALSCASTARPTTAPVWERRVAYDGGVLTVTTCFGREAPRRFELPERRYPFTATARAARDATAVPVEARGSSVEVPEGTRCLAQSHDARRLRTGESDVFVLRNSGWLWRPAPLVTGTTVRTRFELPEGWQVSTPWPREDGVYTMDATAMEWEGYTVFGALAREEITLEGTVFDVTREGFADAHSPPVERWLGDAWRSARSLVPEARPPRVQVLLRASSGGAAVGFGLVSRGGGPSVMFFVDPRATEADLVGDWQATHEFVHLVHPVFFDEDAWLREGLATYYQEVLRARSGAQTEGAAWASLLQGMSEGAREGTGATLADESASMGRTHHYHRVYWWGVAVALALDVTLRRESGGRASLDAGLQALYAASAREPERAWGARDAIEVFERATSVPLWTAVVEPALGSREYPDVESALRALGVRRSPDGAVSFDGAAPLAGAREAIMRRR
jgi:hypothetical protein